MSPPKNASCHGKTEARGVAVSHNPGIWREKRYEARRTEKDDGFMPRLCRNMALKALELS